MYFIFILLGAGTVLETLSLGKPLITVINEKLMHNHQMELALQMQKDGHSLYCNCRLVNIYLLYFSSPIELQGGFLCVIGS